MLKRNYLCHFARVILYFQGTYVFSNLASSLCPSPTVTICMLWFIRLLENTSIYQLWGSTDCWGTDQAASLARGTSSGGGGEKKKRGENGNRRKVGVQRTHWCLCFCFPAEPHLPFFSPCSWCAHRPLAIWFFFHPYFWCSHCSPMNLYLFFSHQQICSECLCIVYTVLEALALCRAPGGI